MWQPLHKLRSLRAPWGCTEALWSGALCLCSTVHTQDSWVLMPGCTRMCPPGRSWTARLTLGCLTGAGIMWPCPLMRAGVWPPPFYLLPPGLSILLLRLIYAALPSTSWLFCCSVLLCCSALSNQSHHLPSILPFALFLFFLLQNSFPVMSKLTIIKEWLCWDRAWRRTCFYAKLMLCKFRKKLSTQ